MVLNFTIFNRYINSSTGVGSVRVFKTTNKAFKRSRPAKYIVIISCLCVFKYWRTGDEKKSGYFDTADLNVKPQNEDRGKTRK